MFCDENYGLINAKFSDRAIEINNKQIFSLIVNS